MTSFLRSETSLFLLKICFQVTSGGETHRLGTGETGPALAEGRDQVSHYHVKDGGGGDYGGGDDGSGGDGGADEDRDEDKHLKI